MEFIKTPVIECESCHKFTRSVNNFCPNCGKRLVRPCDKWEQMLKKDSLQFGRTLHRLITSLSDLQFDVSEWFMFTTKCKINPWRLSYNLRLCATYGYAAIYMDSVTGLYSVVLDNFREADDHCGPLVNETSLDLDSVKTLLKQNIKYIQ